MAQSREKKNLMLGLAFLTPNILGFLALTIIPLVLSLGMAFTNWDLTLHNMFKDNDIKFVGLDNFIRLFQERNSLQVLRQHAVLHDGHPVRHCRLASAGDAVDSGISRAGSKKIWATLLVSAVFVFGIAMLMAAGLHATAMGMLLVTLVGVMLIGGISGGSVVYRTLYFLPSFTAGVAVYILWAKLYSKNTGPINTALRPVLAALSKGIASVPPWVVQSGGWLCLGLTALIVFLILRKLYAMWWEGELGWSAAIVPVVFVILPVALMQKWMWSQPSIVLGVLTVGYGIYLLFRASKGGREFDSTPSAGFGSGAMLALAAMVTEFLLIGLAIVFLQLPDWVATAKGQTLDAPDWLGSTVWAKPALMIMGFWAAIGSRNMLLYIAGLSNIPPELYEAADIDGASTMQRFLARDLAAVGADDVLHRRHERDRRPPGRLRDGPDHDSRRPRRRDDHTELLHLQRGLHDGPARLRIRHRLDPLRRRLHRHRLQLEIRQPLCQRLRRRIG